MSNEFCPLIRYDSLVVPVETCVFGGVDTWGGRLFFLSLWPRLHPWYLRTINSDNTTGHINTVTLTWKVLTGDLVVLGVCWFTAFRDVGCNWAKSTLWHVSAVRTALMTDGRYLELDGTTQLESRVWKDHFLDSNYGTGSKRLTRFFLRTQVYKALYQDKDESKQFCRPIGETCL